MAGRKRLRKRHAGSAQPGDQRNLRSAAQYELDRVIGKRNQSGVPYLQKLKPIHRKIIELYLEGMSHTDIGFMLGVDPQGVSHIIRDPLSQEIIEYRKESDEADFQALFPKAVKAVSDGLDSPRIGDRLKAVDRYFRATKRYAPEEQSKSDSFAEVAARALQVAQTNANTVERVTRNPDNAKLINATPEQIEEPA